MMMRRFSLLVLALFVGNAESRSSCIGDYSNSIVRDESNVCQHLNTLIVCLGNDKDATSDDMDLLNVQKNKHKQCNVIVKPSITSVGRQLRVVTEEDVVFNRFRRDEMGIFELRDKLTDTNESLAKLQQTVLDQFNHVNENVSKRIDDGMEQTSKAIEALENEGDLKQKATDSAIDALGSKVELLEAFVKANQGEKSAWFNAGPMGGSLPYNEATNIRISGQNLAPYYDGTQIPTIACIFQGDGNSFTTFGHVDREESNDRSVYVIRCNTPTVIAKNGPTKYNVTIKAGRTDVDFMGLPGANFVTFDAVATGVEAKGDKMFVSLSGGHTSGSYQCFFTVGSTTINKPGTLAGSAKSVSCDIPTPAQLKLTKAQVQISVTVRKNNRPIAPSAYSSGFTIDYDYSANGRLDDKTTGGTETDIDCGGPFSPPCALNKKCLVNDDCNGTLFHQCMTMNNKKVCIEAGDGSTKDKAGQSCKQIVADYPRSRNGPYWIRGIGNVFSNPVQVFCWMEDRDGGGWMLGIKHQYHNSRPLGPNSYHYPTKTTASDLLTARNAYQYKVDDRIIRANIGQTDNQNSEEMFDVMVDQAGINSYYTAANREYVIMRNYVAHWEFSTIRTVRNSRNWGSPQSDRNNTWLESYAIENFNGRDPVGDGTLIWKGKTSCYSGSNGRRGIYCSNAAMPGSVVVGRSRPNGGPGGGRYCMINLGRNRWVGNPHFCMYNYNRDSYLYMCNGPQHSSGYDMTHRWWFRASKSRGKA